MKIYPALYNREDGLSLIRLDNDKWSIRSARGVAYFWNFITKKWIVAHSLVLDLNKSSDFHETFERAMQVFETVPDPQISISFKAVKV